MNWWSVGFASAVILALVIGQYYRQRRALGRIQERPGLRRTEFVEYFSQTGIPARVSTAVFDSLVGSNLSVDPGDDLSTVYEMDDNLFLDSLAGLRRDLSIDKRTLGAAWKEFGNVSTVRDLVQMVALAWQRREHA